MPVTVSDELIALARRDLARHRFPDIEVARIKRGLAEYRCSPNYPEVVAHNIMLARELCVAGCVFHEPFTVALHYTGVSEECALMELFLQSLDLPFTMKRTVNGKPETKTFPQRPSIYEFAHAGWKLVGPQGAKCRNFASLIAWAEETSLITPREVKTFEFGRRTRNLTAHGHKHGGTARVAVGCSPQHHDHAQSFVSP